MMKACEAQMQKVSVQDVKRSVKDCRSRLLSFAFDAPQAVITATNEENGKIEKEIELFLSFPIPHSSTNPLKWWSQYESHFSIMASVFSIAGTLFQKNRMALKPDNADKIIFMNLNEEFLNQS